MCVVIHGRLPHSTDSKLKTEVLKDKAGPTDCMLAITILLRRIRVFIVLYILH